MIFLLVLLVNIVGKKVNVLLETNIFRSTFLLFSHLYSSEISSFLICIFSHIFWLLLHIVVFPINLPDLCLFSECCPKKGGNWVSRFLLFPTMLVNRCCTLFVAVAFPKHKITSLRSRLFKD